MSLLYPIGTSSAEIEHREYIDKMQREHVADLTQENRDMVKLLRDIAEKIKRCDYTQARNDALIILSKYD